MKTGNIGSRVRLHYKPGIADELTYIGEITEMHEDGGFEFKPDDGSGGWSVMRAELDRGDLTVEVL